MKNQLIVNLTFILSDKTDVLQLGRNYTRQVSWTVFSSLFFDINIMMDAILKIYY